MVEELFPTLVTVMGQMDVNDGVSLGSNGFCDQRHPGLIGRAAPFAGVTARTGTDQILPSGFSPGAPGDNMVQRQFRRGKSFPAILTPIPVPGKNIPSIKFHRRSWQTIIYQQTDDSWNGNVEMDG